jgi:hypothetical protein
MGLRGNSSGAISSPMASKTARNCWSQRLSNPAALHLFQPPGQVLMRGQHLAQLDEGPHDGDVDLTYLIRIARGLRSTPESIATPCSVKARG